MGEKNKTVSFRIGGEKFETLRAMADQRDLSLSSMFRDYVDQIVAHDGRVEIVPEHGVREEASAPSSEFPLTVEVPKSFVREHERLELESEHLREQLDEYKQYAAHLESELESAEAQEAEMVRLEDLDLETGTSLRLE
ncbi:CopG family transcriptional regulator [Natronomonas salina]|uniref:CopG family transcriptional regulator n=1 Tax=Natronomonas salina TaxID=1710540 RepID=UPI0015B6D21D|nr:CopG family transcriptional regulator [Natronomonas salina]QLD90538.1 CopG family transcriptional regulator [Natronomonas salina]